MKYLYLRFQINLMEDRVEKIEELVAISWLSDELIPEEFFDDDPIMHDIILQIEEDIENKAVFIDRNIIIHGKGLYEALFKKGHFESIKDKIKQIERKAEKIEES